jgi:hypothetical protein
MSGNSHQNPWRALSPQQVAGYLRSHGWVDAGRYGPHGRLYTIKQNGRQFDVVVPTTTAVVDFEPRMKEVVRTIGEAEMRPRKNIFEDLLISGFDLIRVRSLNADNHGAIAFQAGLQLHDDCNRMIIAAALSAASDIPRKAWKGRRPELVEEYLKRVRLGQTQKASYAITLLSPYAFDLNSNLGFFDESFGRRVSHRLAQALGSVEAALQESLGFDDPVPVFEQYVEKGVSADICLSLARIAENSEIAELTITPSHSKFDGNVTQIVIEAQQAPVLLEVARAFEAEEPEPDYIAQGFIELIRGQPSRSDGSVVLICPNPEGRGVRRVRVLFSAEDRQAVYNAGRDQKVIRVTGDLSRSKGKFTLRNPRGFVALEIPDDE